MPHAQICPSLDHACLSLVSLVLHRFFGWRVFADEAQQHGQTAELAGYLNEVMRDTFENRQSEFLQLLWQVVGLAYFLYLGSPASKENDDRIEAKLDALMRMIGGGKAQKVIARLDHPFERREGHAQPHAHGEDYVHQARLEVPLKR